MGRLHAQVVTQEKASQNLLPSLPTAICRLLVDVRLLNEEHGTVWILIQPSADAE